MTQCIRPFQEHLMSLAIRSSTRPVRIVVCCIVLIVTVLSLVLGSPCTASDIASKKTSDGLDSISHYMRALQLYIDGDYTESEKEFDQVLNSRPSDAYALSGRGLARGKLRRFREAMQDHDKAIKLLPNSPEFHDARGQSYQEAKDFTRALADYGHALRLCNDKRKAQPLLHRGILFLQSGKYREAMTDLNACVRVCADCPEPLYYRALAHEKLGNASASRKDLYQARTECLKLIQRKYRHRTRPPLESLLNEIERERLRL